MNEELIEYKKINITDYNSEDTIEKLRNLKPEPVLIQGYNSADITAETLQKCLNFCNEVAYQKDSLSPNYLLYSILDAQKYIRPQGMIKADNLYPSFCDYSTTTSLNLTELWKQSNTNNETESLKNFFKEFLIIPKGPLKIQGILPITPAILTLNWFMRLKTKLDYNSLEIE